MTDQSGCWDNGPGPDKAEILSSDQLKGLSLFSTIAKFVSIAATPFITLLVQDVIKSGSEFDYAASIQNSMNFIKANPDYLVQLFGLYLARSQATYFLPSRFQSLTEIKSSPWHNTLTFRPLQVLMQHPLLSLSQYLFSI